MSEHNDQFDSMGKVKRLLLPLFIGGASILIVGGLVADLNDALAGGVYERENWTKFASGVLLLLFIAGWIWAAVDKRLDERPLTPWLFRLLWIVWSVRLALDHGWRYAVWTALGVSGLLGVIYVGGMLLERWQASRPKPVRTKPLDLPS